MKKIILFLCISTLTFFVSSCLTPKKTSGWVDFSNNNSLDSIQLVHKEIYNKFFTALYEQDDKKIISLSMDTVFCVWESGLDSSQVFKEIPLTISVFLADYYQKIFVAHSKSYYLSSSNLCCTHEGEVGTIIQKVKKGFTLVFGPKSCIDKCDFINFAFVKTERGYKFYGMWQY